MAERLVFLGAGRMASAIVTGLISGDEYAPGDIVCTCGDDPTGPELARKTGIAYLPDISEVLLRAECLVLACKPQQFEALGDDLAKAASGKLVLSILAGTPLAKLGTRFADARNIVRTMPNTPGRIGAGVTAYAPLRELTEPDEAIVTSVLGALGSVHKVAESQMDAVTAVSGSGPAYLFEFVAALREAGLEAGLSRDFAQSLALETVLGSARLLQQSGEDPETLRDAVTSKGGTTAAALETLGEGGFRQLIGSAVAAAKARSVELARPDSG